jgi:nucleoside-diphosphate-sugar epimerase
VRVLVLGGSGFIGAAAVGRLRERGCEVATFHRSESASIRGDRADLGSHQDAFARLAPDVVLDTIAYTEQDGTALVATFRSLAGRAVVLSSQDVSASYGRLMRLEPGAPDREPSDEDAPLRASRFPYRATARPGEMAYDYDKILVERAAAADPALPVTVLRLPCVYGAGDRHHRVGRVLARMLSGQPVLLDRARAAWRWTRGSVENVADAIALAAMDRRASGRTYNVGEETALTEAEWTRAIGRASGWSGEVRAVAKEDQPAGFSEPYDFEHDLVADTRRIRRELGYRERLGLEEVLEAAVAWERAHPIQN